MSVRRALALAALAGCNAPAAPADDAAARGPVAIAATVDSTRFVTREHMLAAGEMQLSGEPLAEAMGRSLASYSRFRLPTDLYYDPQRSLSWIDLAGFSTAIESYEYSKQPMNNLMLESGAGTALAYGPLVTATGGDLGARLQHYAAGSHALGRFAFASEPLAWPGLWPTNHVFASFDPAIDPARTTTRACAITSDDNPGAMAGVGVISADYECDATSLHLRDRAAQIDPTLTPGADGFSAWKYGLWVINYLQIMHDPLEHPVATVSAADLAQVGIAGNTVAGADADDVPTMPGTYLGSSDLEGFQAQLFVASVDNRAEDWLAHLSTTDGVTLSGFASTAEALAYAYDSPLRWYPAIRVAETAGADGFPRPSYTLASAAGDALDLVGLALGYAEFYALTDRTNGEVGGAQAARALFDGDPFDGGLHDRALAILRTAVIDLDRRYTDPATGLLADRAGGHTLSTTTLAYTVLGLRTVLRALDGQLALYSNTTPDTAIADTPLDALPLHYPGDPALTFSARAEQILRAHAALLYDHLTDDTGRAWGGWDGAANAPVDDADTLDAHAAAVRGLFAAYLATGDVRYRERAVAVFDRMDATFFDPAARVYLATAGANDVTYTPLRFALVQSALRDLYELVATRPGNEARIAVLEDRLARVNKLVLNGWDDRDGNRIVDYPTECVNVVDGVPRGGLQMAERTLTGELGGLPTADRDRDCVPDIADAHLPAGLADSITFHLARP